MASRPKLTFACGSYDRFDALAQGQVQPKDIDLKYITVDNPRELFDRMLMAHEFDLCEMSSSEYICRYAAGERDLVAIPIFPSRAFRHSYIVVNTDIVKGPSDLNGKRIGVQFYTMTAAVWIRGVLKDLGVDLDSITWVEGHFEKPGQHTKQKSKPLHKPVHLIKNENPDKSLSDLLEAGEIAATIGADVPACLGRAPNIARLFSNVREAEKQYFRETAIFPIMHLVAIRQSVLDNAPSVASSLYDAMNDSKNIALSRMKKLSTYKCMLPFLSADMEEIEQYFGGDPWPYGLEANRTTLEALVHCLCEQGMIPRMISVDELFVPIQ